MSKVILWLLWFCIATLCDWLKNLAPLSGPIRIKIETNGNYMHALYRAWRLLHDICVLIGSLDCLCLLWFAGFITWFWFYDTQLKTSLVESNFAIALVLHCYALIGKKRRATFSTNQKKNQNQSWHACVRFLALGADDKYLLQVRDWFIGLSVSVVFGQGFYF